jgi:hypothetical protein
MSDSYLRITCNNAVVIIPAGFNHLLRISYKPTAIADGLDREVSGERNVLIFDLEACFS